jgi:hypothetical protein
MWINRYLKRFLLNDLKWKDKDLNGELLSELIKSLKTEK